MSIQLKQVAAILCAAGLMSVPVISFAEANDASSVQNDVSSEVAGSESSVAPVKAKKKLHRAKKHSKHVKHAKHKPASDQSNVAGDVANVSGPSQPASLPFDLYVPGRSFVSSGPYVGLPYSFSGSNLIINSPSVNTDVQLLNTRKSIIKHLNETVGNLSGDTTPHLLLSGIVEGQADIEKRDGKTLSDINVTNVSIDALLLGPSDWLLGYVELSYDSSPTPAGTFRVANSNIYLNKAFVTIGNFNKSPVYGSFGQFYVPFGTYSSVMVSDPFTKLLARTKARAALIGYQQQDEKSAAYASIYAFRGDTDATPNTNRINNGGLNVGYKFDADSVSGNLGGGFIANLADSVGMQSSGFALDTSNENLQHRVPAYNLRGTLSIGQHVDIIAEGVAATKRFSPLDMTFNSHGAKPWAANLEASYSFKISDFPSNVGIGTSRTGQALALGIPETRYSAVFNTSLLQHTLQSVEFRRDHLYGSSDTASVSGVPVASGNGIYDNVLTVQFDYYF